jgi:septal ring factor EnvC (AmiA/AmiB activator)
MKASQKLIDHIKRTECNNKPILEAIWDKTGKVWMIGYGHSPGDVKQGDKIQAKQAIGEIVTSTNDDNKTELYFQIYKDRTILNPTLWLAQ